VVDALFDDPAYSERCVYHFRHFVFSLDYDSSSAWNHRAAEAAHLQGLFWPMAEEIFADAPIYEEELLFAKAESVGLDMDQFYADYGGGPDGGVVWAQIVEDTAAGGEAGVFGTPFIFVNGVMVFPWSSLQEVLDCLLGYSVYVPPDAGVDGGGDAG
jgi:protein-disulfide isomerase